MKAYRLLSLSLQGIVLAVAVLSVLTTGAKAVTLPGSADAGRIEGTDWGQPIVPNLLAPSKPAELFPFAEAPEASKRVTVKLNAIRIDGMTAFTDAEVRDIYAPFLGHEITLDTLWVIAGQLTERYRQAGYFLSQAVVPPQKVSGGTMTLLVVEGYIGEIKFDHALAHNFYVKQWVDRLQQKRPVTADQLESVLLHLNDLPGVNLRAVLEPMLNDEGREGSVRLVLEQKEEPLFSGTIGADNFGSRFLGPYETQAQVRAVFLPMQRTTMSVLSSQPWDKMRYGSLKHELPLFARAMLELYGSYTTAFPGYTLKPENIKSVSSTVGAAVNYSLIRQRQENLSTRVAVERQDTASNILGLPLTRDAIRTLRVALMYQFADNWNGQNTLNGTLSQGLNFWGASQPGQASLSRAGARPDFTKVELGFSRAQYLTNNWGLLGAVLGQLASGPLYSSEQFGYGGQAVGRAYDNSEIVGDKGVNASAELRYSGMDTGRLLQLVPYVFYDIGAVWNMGQSQTMPYGSGSSFGAGTRLFSDSGFSGNLGMAFPLTRAAANPIYGNGKNPRYFMQVLYSF